MLRIDNEADNPQYNLNLIDEGAQDAGPRREIIAFFASMYRLLVNQNQLDLETRRKFEWHQASISALRTPNADVIFLITYKVVPFLLEEMRQPCDVRKNFDVFVPEHFPNLPEFNEIMERRKICHFLCDFESVLQKNNMIDETTNLITEWHRLFVTELSLQLENPQAIFEKYAEIAAEFLKDPCFAPLDKNALLGSDGLTYGTMSLSVILSFIPEELRHKPPLDLDNPMSFTTIPHPVVRFLIEWLESREFILPNTQKLTNDYLDLVNSGKVPLIPTKRTEKWRLVREILNQNEREALERLEQLDHNLEIEGFGDQARVALDNLRIQFENGRNANFERLEIREQRRQEDLRLLMLHGQAHLENVQILGEEVDELQEFLDELQGAVGDLKRENVQLKIELKELQRQNAKRNGGFFKILGQVAIMAVTTWAIGYMLPPNVYGAVMKSGSGAQFMLNAKF